MSTPWSAARGRALATLALAAALGFGAAPATAGPGSPGSEDVSVRFGDGCSSAVITATGPVSALETVFSDERRERVGDLPRAASYIVRMAPAAVASGLTIDALYVHRGEQRTEWEPGGAGSRFDCESRPRERAPVRRRRGAGRPAG